MTNAPVRTAKRGAEAPRFANGAARQKPMWRTLPQPLAPQIRNLKPL